MLSTALDELSQVVSVSELPDLKRIEDRDVEAVQWVRRVPEKVQDCLRDVSRGAFRNGRFSLNAEVIGKCVLEHFQANRISLTRELEWLAGDVQGLADEMSALFKSPYLRLRLEAVANDACRKFHADNIKARLICTYAGPGTEIGLAGDAEVPSDIRRVETGQPILLKGLKWPETKTRQLKHRSPPIEGTGQKRFVVVLEPVTPDTEQLNGTYVTYPKQG